jgi:hypothetical protein
MNFDANGRRIKKSLPQKLHYIYHTTPGTSTFSSKFDTISDSALISFRGMIHDNKLSECEAYLKELEAILQ